MSEARSVFFTTAVALLLCAGCEQEQNRMVVLFFNVNKPNAAEITAFLKENEYKYKLDNGGSIILVPKDLVCKARMSLAISGLPPITEKGYEILGISFGMVDFTNLHLSRRKVLEAELACSIESMREVEQARVQIIIPKKTLFMDSMDRYDPYASVILKIRQGEVLQHEQLKGIQHLVAGAVDSLEASRVSVLDDYGSLLAKGENIDENLETKWAAELFLKKQVMAFLDEALGKNKAVVAISVNLDFKKINQEAENVYGVDKNGFTTIDIKKSARKIISDGTERLAVSVLADCHEDGIDTLTQSVKNIVGFSQERGDTVYIGKIKGGSL
jgi:flagellar M-ring protein FliF